MSKTAYIAIIVEGFDREPQIVNNMLSIYFKPERFKIISFPAEQKIYMLWNLLKKDDYETDLIEVIREYSPYAAKVLGDLTRSDFSEMYLFFDYDGHQQNLPQNSASTNEVIKEMLDTFNNETDLGKLYISYPMVEALRDYVPAQCTPATSCFWPLDDIGNYKHDTGVKSQFTNVTRYQHPDWSAIMNVFIMRLSCLFQKDSVLTFDEYRQCISPLSIFDQQYCHITQQEVFVLSAFPEFLLDYFKIDFWKAIIEYSKLRPSTCELLKRNS